MLDWPCEFEKVKCTSKSAPIIGSCVTCAKHYCADHVDHTGHACPGLSGEDQLTLERTNEDTAIMDLQAKLNGIDFYKLGETARPGFKVIGVETSVKTIPHGDYNYHVPLEFDDGKIFYAGFNIIRFDTPPQEVRRLTTESKITTMEVLREAGLPVPLTIRCNRDDTFLVEKIAGTPCASPFQEFENPELVLKIIPRLAEIYIKLSELPFAGIGSLYRNAETGKVEVGPLCSQQLFINPKAPYFQGPFKTNRERYLHQIDDLIGYLFQGKRAATNPSRQLLVYLWLRDMIEHYAPFGKEEPSYIKHDDDRGANIMIDDEGNIVGILDWDWASTVPASEAFSSPTAVTRNSIIRDTSNQLQGEEIELLETYEKMGRTDLADYIRSGRIHLRLDCIIGRTFKLHNLLGLEKAMTGSHGAEEDMFDFEDRLKAQYGVVGMEASEAMLVLKAHWKR